MVPSQVRDLMTDLLQRQRAAEVPVADAEPGDVAMDDAAEPCSSDLNLRDRTHSNSSSASFRRGAQKTRAAAGLYHRIGKGAERGT
jgi:hypothetical protein